jgi:cystathionine beta-synthase
MMPTGRIVENILQTIGRTPLVRLARMARGLRVEICAKVESFNPGGSVKDRIGLAMIEAAEREGLLPPGGTIVEATAGNTGVGLALAAAIKGYRCIFVLPDKMSADKVDLLKAYGAEVVITPTSVAPDSPQSYNGVAERLSREIPGAFRPNQFANPNNPQAHYLSTGPEIWEDTGGRLEAFVAGMGTGGTISGVGRYLKERNPKIVVVGADPAGSILSGDSPHGYKVEGIGEDFIPRTFTRQVVDEMIRVSDRESFNTARRLAREEGILAGGSAGTALAAALKYAERLSGGERIVVLLPDTGRNYLSKIYSDRWMQENGFWEGEVQPRLPVARIVEHKKRLPLLIAASPEDRLSRVVRLLEEHAISRMPVLEGERAVGSISETTLVQLAAEGRDLETLPVREAMGRPLPEIDGESDLQEARRLLLSGASALLVRQAGRPWAVITEADLIEHYYAREEQ